MLSCRIRIIFGVIFLLTVLIQMSGCGGGAVSGIRNMVAITKAVALIPDDWSSSGGMIKILADITGDGIREVRAFIKKLGSSETEPIILTLNDKGEYEGEYKAEENPNSAEPDKYSVVVTATDVSNTTDSEKVSFEVPASE